MLSECMRCCVNGMNGTVIISVFVFKLEVIYRKIGAGAASLHKNF